MALAGVELEALVFETDALTTVRHCFRYFSAWPFLREFFAYVTTLTFIHSLVSQKTTILQHFFLSTCGS